MAQTAEEYRQKYGHLYTEAEQSPEASAAAAPTAAAPSAAGQPYQDPNLQSYREKYGHLYSDAPVAASGEVDNYDTGIGYAFMRGFERLRALPDVAQGDYEELAGHYGSMDKWKMSTEDAARLEEIRGTEGFWKKAGQLFMEPRLVLQTVAESLPMMAAPIVGAVGGGVAGGAATGGNPIGAVGGSMVGGGLGSYFTEYYNSVGEYLSEQGVDLSNAAQLKAAFENPEMLDGARQWANKRGIPIAVFDALSMGLAGRIAKPISGMVGKVTGGRKIGAGVAGELTMQAGAGMAGEAGAQLASEGEIHDELDVIMEGIAELVPGVVESGVSSYVDRKAAARKAGVADPDESPLAALDEPAPAVERPITATDIDPQTGKVVTRTGDVEYDQLDVALEDGLAGLQMDLEIEAFVKDVAGEAVAAAEAKPEPVGLLEQAAFDEQEAAAAAERQQQEDTAYDQQAEQIAVQDEAGAVESEMVTPEGMTVEGEPIDVAGAQPATEGQILPEGINPVGGRPLTTNLGEAMRGAGVVPPDDEGPSGGAGEPVRGPDATAAEARAAATLEAEEEARAEREAIQGEPGAVVGPEEADIPFPTLAPEPEIAWADERLADESYHGGLDRLVSETQERGGVTLIPDMDMPGVTDPSEATAFKGRTPSTNPAWMQAIVSEERVGRKYIIKAVDNAKAGKRLGAKQKRVVEAMLNELDDPSEYQTAPVEEVSAFELEQEQDGVAPAPAPEQPRGEVSPDIGVPGDMFSPGANAQVDLVDESRAIARKEGKGKAPVKMSAAEIKKLLNRIEERMMPMRNMEKRQQVGIDDINEMMSTLDAAKLNKQQTERLGRLKAALEKVDAFPEREPAVMRGTESMYDEVFERMDLNNPVPVEDAKVGDTILEDKADLEDSRYGYALVLDVNPATGSKLIAGLQDRGPAVDPARGNKPVTRDAGLYFRSEPYQGYGTAYSKKYETLQQAIDEFRAAGDQQIAADFVLDEKNFDRVGQDTNERVFTPTPPIDVKKRKAIDTKLKNIEFITPEDAEERLSEWEDNAIQQGKDSRTDKGPQSHKDNFNRVIISLFDTTGKWANPYALAGYDVRALDIKDGIDVTDFSVQFMDEMFGNFEGKEIYGIIAACPCTTFSNSSTKWRRSDLPPDHPQNRHENADPEYSRKWIEEMWGKKAADAVDENGDPLYATPHDYAIALVHKTMQTLEYFRPKFWAVENPEGRIEKEAGMPGPWRTGFQPSNFGDPYTKRTLLWGNFNDNLPTANVDPVEGSKMHMMSPSEDRAAQRSETPEGFALSFFQANNYLDTSPVERTKADYWYIEGAIEEAFRAGVTEDQIRERVYLDDSYEPESASVEDGKAELRKLIDEAQGGPTTTPGGGTTPPSTPDLDAALEGLGDFLTPQIHRAVPSEADIAAAAAEADPDGATEAQKEAGNYKKGHLKIAGLDFTIENPAGTVRHGNLKLRDHYGYIKRTEGADGDQVDTFVNSKAQEDWTGDVYVVDQIFPEVGGFDEHKVMFGYNNQIDARRAYRRNFNKDWKGQGAVTKMTLAEFKSWLAEPGANKKPASLSPVTKEGREARAKANKDMRYASGKDLLNAPSEKWLKSLLGDARMHGDVPDTTPLNIAVSELLKIQEQREGAPAAPARPSFEAIDKALRPVEDSLPGAPVTLLHNYRQAPKGIVKALMDQGMTHVKAVFDPQTNEIYMFADRIGSIDEATRTSLHEKAHRGLRVAFGEKLNPLLDDIFTNVNKNRQADMQTIADEYKLNPGMLEDRRIIAEELLAHMAENNVNDGMVKRAIASIRKLLRDMGITLEFTDNDIRALIREAQGAVGRNRPTNLESVMIEEEVIVEGSDEIFIVEQNADVALTGVDNRIEICRKLRKCL